ncbi:hypothetical protein BZG36_02061 [Bifiguratus adelaidae]|uniref:Single-stranded DNA-binding protein n=1 Tax=Bifiguratus adelaidae TaxID=1938954 RepID=A0A261Y1X2_9FUNG|nr:hypothetical protein BZG36_02061 [Bifiguratus adelaidae]
MASLGRLSRISVCARRTFSTTSVVRSSVNKATLVGYVGADPEITTFDNDRSVVRYTLATTETSKDKAGDYIQNTQWHKVISWNPQTNEYMMDRLRKGAMVYVEGKIQYGEYTAKDGTNKNKTEINQSKIQILSPGKHTGEPREHEED